MVNKNLCFYYWLKKRIGKGWAFRVANTIEKTILILEREVILYSNRNGEAKQRAIGMRRYLSGKNEYEGRLDRERGDDSDEAKAVKSRSPNSYST